jgi:hypothetical protein
MTLNNIIKLCVIINTLILSSAISGQKGGPDMKIICPGNRLELFVDDYLVSDLTNITFRLHTPVDEGPVIFFNKPWEGIFSGYSTIIKDDSIFRLYYRGVPTIGSDGSNAEVTCYAESRDGINWTKPGLGLFEINGSWQNNVILANAAPVTHNFSPFRDDNPAIDDGYRFKALGGSSGGLIPYGSSDGIHWIRLSQLPVVTGGEFDSQNVYFWSVSESC